VAAATGEGGWTPENIFRLEKLRSNPSEVKALPLGTGLWAWVCWGLGSSIPGGVGGVKLAELGVLSHPGTPLQRPWVRRGLDGRAGGVPGPV